tara:strand:- start:4524 stop:5249 length:726 start_codon:yes stop_codon:yes gene_type:complete
MKNKKLGVNIDHVATVRNARGENYPDPVNAALICEKYGADSVTIHLREDRRHIRDIDLLRIKKKIKIPLNLEIAPTFEMLKIAKKYKPNYVCIVPEKRNEITTEGGLNLKRNKNIIKKITSILKKNKIRVSFFIEPKINDVILSKKLGASCVELHTGKYCNILNKNKNVNKSYNDLKKSAALAKNIGLEVHAGHGLTYKSAKKIMNIAEITEFNIGHFIVSESLFFGLGNVIKKFKKIIRV